MSFGRFHTDCYIALIFLVTAIVAVSLGYDRFIQVEQPRSPLDGIPIGDHRYGITARNRCIGWLEVSAKFDEHYDINGKGKLRVSVAGKPFDIELEYQSGFNSLGQLAGALLRLNRGTDELQVGLREVNPITFSFRASFAGQEYQVEREIPGPVQIVERSDSTLGIRYRYLPMVTRSQREFRAGPLLNVLDLNVVSFESGDSCGAVNTEHEPLALDQLLGQVSGLLDTAITFSGGGR